MKPAASSESDETTKWRCMVCGYIAEGKRPPKICPKCGAPEEDFEMLDDVEGDEHDSIFDELIHEHDNSGEHE